MDWIIIITIVLLIIFLFVFLIFAFLNWDSYQHEIVCPEGECPTSIITGEKNCSRREYNPSVEVCSLPESCSSSLLTNGVNSDVSTNSIDCPEDQECRCSRDSTCARYITVTFSYDSSGNPYQNLYTVGRPRDGECSMSIDSFFIPGGFCTPTDWSDEATKRQDIITCIQGNPCAQGMAAYITDPSQFRTTDYAYYPVACVQGITGMDSLGNPIEENSVPIWDDQWGGVIQKSLG